MKKPAIQALQTGDQPLDDFARDVKLTLDTLTGQHQNVGRLDPLPATATLAQVITRLNLLLDRQQGS